MVLHALKDGDVSDFDIKMQTLKLGVKHLYLTFTFTSLHCLMNKKNIGLFYMPLGAVVSIKVLTNTRKRCSKVFYFRTG